MCGIVGIVTDKAGLRDRLKLAMDRLIHRGPDDSGFYERGPVAMGFRRLAVIDLETGNQPIVSQDGRFVITFNGEIYNFLSLRKDLEAQGEFFAERSDTEVLLRLFMRRGLEGCLQELRGMFAFAVWDRETKTLSLARDRLGVKPLVYSENGRGFVFASEIGALFDLQPDLSREPDYGAIDLYLTFQYIPSPLSGFAAVRKLPPAHALTVKEGRVERLWRYWRIDPGRKTRISFPEACEALREKVLEATKIRLISDVPLGAFLSGGIDSSITVAAMSRLDSKPVETFCIGFPEKEFDELAHAKKASLHLGTSHHEMVVRPEAVDVLPRLVQHYGEPLADNSAIPTYYVSQFARQRVTVALTGDGGDEVFGGYRRFFLAAMVDFLEAYHLLPLWRALRRLTVFAENLLNSREEEEGFPSKRRDAALYLEGMERYTHLLAFILDREKDRLLTPAFRQQAGKSRPSEYLSQFFQQWAEADFINRYLYLDMHTYLPEDILFKVDISSMMNSLECRSPFLDHRLIEFVASLPGTFKIRPVHRHKHLLKEAFKDWLPAGFMDRGKMGFSAPMPRWLKNELAPLLEERLLVEKTLSPWVRQEEIQKYVEEHLSGRKSHSKRLWPFMILAEWIKGCRVAL